MLVVTEQLNPFLFTEFNECQQSLLIITPFISQYTTEKLANQLGKIKRRLNQASYISTFECEVYSTKSINIRSIKREYMRTGFHHERCIKKRFW